MEISSAVVNSEGRNLIWFLHLLPLNGPISSSLSGPISEVVSFGGKICLGVLRSNKKQVGARESETN